MLLSLFWLARICQFYCLQPPISNLLDSPLLAKLPLKTTIKPLMLGLIDKINRFRRCAIWHAHGISELLYQQIKQVLGKLSKKNRYKYGIFHILVDPPPLWKKNHYFFMVLKCFSDTSKTFYFFPLIKPKTLRKFSSVGQEGGGSQGKKIKVSKNAENGFRSIFVSCRKHMENDPIRPPPLHMENSICQGGGPGRVIFHMLSRKI